MDARQLRFFLAVVDHHGFSRAAENLLISQPSLSQTIAVLERELDIALFHRVGRRAVLSAAGEQLVGHARQVLRDLETAQSAMDALKGLRSGRLDIITQPSPGLDPLTPMIARFTALHPSVTLNVEAAFTPEEVVETVRSGGSEIGLLGTRAPLHVAGVDTLQLETQALVLIVNPTADTFGPVRSLRRSDLAGHRLIASQTGSLMRWMVDDILASGVDVQIVVEVAHRTSILPLVLNGVGHAVMASAWESMAHKVGLRTLRIEQSSELHVALISRQTHLTPFAMSFLETASQYATESHS